MSAAEDRVRALGEAAAGKAADALAVAIRADVAGVSVERIEGGVAIVGRNLQARLIDEPGLRWPGGLVR